MPVRIGWRGLAQGPTCIQPFRTGNALAARPFSVVPTSCSSSRRSALLRLLSSGPGSDGGAEELDQASGQLEAAEGKTTAGKEELKSAEGKLKTAEGRLEAAKEEFKTAEGKLDAAKEEFKTAEGKLEAATDPQQKALTQTAYNLAVENVNTARENVNTARENVNRAGRVVDIALDALQRAGAEAGGAPEPNEAAPIDADTSEALGQLSLLPSEDLVASLSTPPASGDTPALQQRFNAANSPLKLFALLGELLTARGREPLDKAERDVLVKGKITGSRLLRMTEERLMRAGMEYGPATDIMELVEGAKELSTPADVLYLMDTIAREGNFARRTRPFHPGYHYADQTFGVCWDREEVVAKAVAYLLDPSKSVGVGSTVESTGLCATLAGRGCGKSFILDHLSRLHDVRGEEGLLLGDLNDRLVPVCLSFNSQQSISPSENSAGRYYAWLLSRLCHAAFFDTTKVAWQDFEPRVADCWKSENMLGPVVDAIRLYFQGTLGVTDPVLVIAVDEIARCGSEAGPEIVALLKQALDRSPSGCRLLMSTFDDQLLEDGEPAPRQRLWTSSKRPIEWLPLKPLSLSKVRHVLALENTATADELDYLMSLSGGHPRSLAILLRQLKLRGTRSLIELEKAWINSFIGYVTGRYLDSSTSTELAVEELLARSILNEAISLKDEVHGILVQDLVASSVLINEVDPKATPRFIPIFSPLYLSAWCEQLPPSPVKMRVARLLACGGDLQHRGFEDFHVAFEDLRCWAWDKLNKSRTTTVMEWFSSGELVRGQDLRVVVPDTNLELASRQNCNLGESSEALASFSLAKSGQPGFDVLMPMGSTLVTCECRYSEPPEDNEQTRTKLSPAEDLRKKVNLAEGESSKASATINGVTVTPANSVFVLFAHRDASSGLQQFAASCLNRPPENRTSACEQFDAFAEGEMSVVVLDRSAVLQHYGPTFARLGGFIMDYDERHHGPDSHGSESEP